MNNFNFFKKECQYWIEKLELSNITFNFYNGLLREDKDDFKGGAIGRIINNSQADVYYDKRDKEKESIRRTAKHEIIHALLLKLYCLGSSRQFTYSEYSREEEELVHKLEKFIN